LRQDPLRGHGPRGASGVCGADGAEWQRGIDRYCYDYYRPASSYDYYRYYLLLYGGACFFLFGGLCVEYILFGGCVCFFLFGGADAQYQVNGRGVITKVSVTCRK